MTINVETGETANSELQALRRRADALAQQLAERERVEAELRAQEARYRLLVESSVDLLSRHTPDGVYLYASAASAAILGYTPDELVGRSAYELVHPDDVERARAAHQAALARSERSTGTYRCRHKDGHDVWIETTSRGLRDPHSGAVLELHCVARDVTGREQTGAALRASEARFQRIVANVPGLVYQFMLHPDGRIEWPFVSEGCRELYGVEPEQIQHDPRLPVEFIAPQDRVSFERALAESAATLEPWKWEGSVILRSGATKSLQCVSRPERLADGAICWDGLVIDVTARTEAEAALRASEERLTSILQTLDDVVWSVDATSGRLVYLSPSAEQLYGYSVEQLRTNPRLLLDVVHPDDRAQYDQYTPQLLAHGSIDVEYRLKRPDGSVRLVHDRGWVVRDRAGRPATINGIVSDITRRVETEAESKRLQAEIIEMQAAMLAELSTPLIPLNDQIVVMPLIGALDSQRVQRVLDTLLNGVTSSRARTAILDITGVPIVDTQIANTLIRAAQAVKLLGADVVLTGIRPEVAQTLVGLGVDLGQIVTRSSLQSGIAYASGRG